jgi:hypothetical protein
MLFMESPMELTMSRLTRNRNFWGINEYREVNQRSVKIPAKNAKY